MHKSQNIEIKPYMKMVDLIERNHSLLLCLQHFNIDLRIGDLTVNDLCEQYDISETLFTTVANLYNGVKSKKEKAFSSKDVLQMIDFLRDTHTYYRNYKYPEIKSCIHKLQEQHDSKELLLLEKFFNTYFEEVQEHFDYEENIAFPYFTKLVTCDCADCDEQYSAKEYLNHHTDIELKLTDLKKLLLKHIKIDGTVNLRRKLLTSLLELEFDLYIHSILEETILVSAGSNFEEKPTC